MSVGEKYAPSLFLSFCRLEQNGISHVWALSPDPSRTDLVVQADLDGHRGVDQPNKSGRHSDKVGRTPVTGTDVSSDIGDETTTDDEDRLLSDETFGVEEVDDLLESLFARGPKTRSARGIRNGEIKVRGRKKRDSRPCSC